MPVSTKTKAVAALAALDVVRQLATAWAAHEKAEQSRAGFGEGLGRDVRRLAAQTRDRLDFSDWELERGWPPVHRRSHARTWVPVTVIAIAAAAGVAVTAHMVARRDEDLESTEAARDSRVVGAVRAGSKAIDAGMMKVVDGGSSAATGTAAAVAAGSSATRSATVDRAKAELDEHVVAPARRKAIVYGSLGFAALTVYVIVIAAIVQLLVGALG